MTARRLHIVDGHDPASGDRFGNFARNVIAGGDVADAECETVKPRASYGVTGRWPFLWIARTSSFGRTFVMPCFPLSRKRAEAIAASMDASYRAGFWECFNL